MTVLASPAQIALSTVAAGWPIAAGMGFVIWSSLRRRREPEEAAAPARLASVIEALDAEEDMEARRIAQRRRASSALPQH